MPYVPTVRLRDCRPAERKLRMAPPSVVMAPGEYNVAVDWK